MTKTLNMPFRTALGKEVNFLVANPKDGLTKVEVAATQALIIARNVFDSTGGDRVTALEPTILIKDVGVLA